MGDHSKDWVVGKVTLLGRSWEAGKVTLPGACGLLG
jgi:hypothetical protein